MSAQSAIRRKRHEGVVMSTRQAQRVRQADGAPAESTPDEYPVGDVDMGRVRRAIEIRQEERELERMLRPGWED